MNELFAPLETRFPQDGMTLMQSLNELFNPSKVKAVEAQDVITYGKSELESVTMHFANQPATGLNDERAIIDCLPFKQNMRRYGRCCHNEHIPKEVITAYSDIFPVLALLAEFYLSITFNSTPRERGFSVQNNTNYCS